MLRLIATRADVTPAVMAGGEVERRTITRLVDCPAIEAALKTPDGGYVSASLAFEIVEGGPEVDEVTALKEALRRSTVALEDWWALTTDGHIDPARVAEAWARIREHGDSLAYIADITKANRALTKARP